jgi:hypothetical protein
MFSFATRQRRERRDYKDLERKQKEAKLAPHQERLRAAISPSVEIASPPPKQSWWNRMFSRNRSAVVVVPSESTPLSSNTRSEVVRSPQETNPFSISDV